MVIYKTTNLVNGKIYIGKTSRNKSIYLGSGILIQKAIKKYGKENFKKEIIEECNEKNWEEKEQYWISKLESKNSKIGYNISDGGDGGDFFTHNPRKEEIRKNMRERVLGKNNPCFNKHWKWTEEQKQKVKGRKFTESHKEKISNATKGNKNPMFGRHENHPNFGKSTPEERKEKISESLKKFFKEHPEAKSKITGAKSLESRAKISRVHKGKKLSEEHRKKLSDSHKGKPGVNLGRKWSEEYKRKMSESCKKAFKLRKEAICCNT